MGTSTTMLDVLSRIGVGFHMENHSMPRVEVYML